MDPRRKRLFDRLFNFVVNSAYGVTITKPPGNLKEAYECYSKLLKRR